MDTFYNYAPIARNTGDDVVDSSAPGTNWQPLRAPLQRLADRLRLQRATAIAVFEQAGISLDPEA